MRRKLRFKGYLQDATIRFVADIWSPLQDVVNMTCRKPWLLNGESKDVRGETSDGRHAVRLSDPTVGMRHRLLTRFGNVRVGNGPDKIQFMPAEDAPPIWNDGLMTSSVTDGCS